MAYAVIKTGGKQYRVTDGAKLRVEKLAVEVDSELIIDQVLAVGNGDDIKVGAPLLAGASVTAKILGHGRADNAGHCPSSGHGTESRSNYRT